MSADVGEREALDSLAKMAANLPDSFIEEMRERRDLARALGELLTLRDTIAELHGTCLIASPRSSATGGRGGAGRAEGPTDSERLDWLERQCYEAVYSADDNDNDVRIGDVMLSGGFAHTFSCEVGDRTVSGIYGESSDTLRAAIDSARGGA